MKKFILCAATLAFFSSLFAQEVGHTTQLQAQINTLELAHSIAILKGDAEALDSLMDDDVTVNHPTNKIVKEKKELLDMILQGVIRYTSFKRTPERFLFFKDMVIVMGSEIVVPAKRAPNAEKTIQRRYTNVWMKKNDKWRLVVRHANNVCLGM